MRRWLPLILVAASYLTPVENLAETLEGELVIRSAWSFLLCVSLYFVLNARSMALVLCCEFWSIAYNLAIASVQSYDIAAAYEPMMTFLFLIELLVTVPWRTRRDSREYRGNRNRYNRRTFVARDVAISGQAEAAICKI